MGALHWEEIVTINKQPHIFKTKGIVVEEKTLKKRIVFGCTIVRSVAQYLLNCINVTIDCIK